MKKIIICFDGTSNDPADAEENVDRKGRVKDNSITNVLKLHLLAGGNLDNAVDTDAPQISLYYSGVGTRGLLIRRLLSAALALLEPKQIRREARKDLAKFYNPGDRVYLFGFSRGAAIARMFASQLHKKPIKVRSGRGKRKVSINIHFLGVWDTVASIGLPNIKDDTRPVGDEVFEDNTIAPNIKKACHLVAVDETRLAFRPTLMNREARVTEIWFPGVHSDIGGGYRKDGLSDICLKFMLDRAKEAGLSFLNANQVDYANLGGKKESDIEFDEVKIEPDSTGKLHNDRDRKRRRAVKDRTLAPREIVVIASNAATGNPPLLHHSVVKRVKSKPGYRPPNLKFTAHQVLSVSGPIKSFNSLNDHIR